MVVKNKLRKTVALALIFMLAPGFASVQAASWADEAMQNMISRQIMDRMPENPSEHITREAFCVMLAKAALVRDAGLSLPPGNPERFADTDKIQSENVPYMTFLYDQNILVGAMIDGKRYRYCKQWHNKHW